MINFNGTTPAAQTGFVLAIWQEDASGNVSVQTRIGGMGAKITVAPIAGVLTIDASLGGSFLINVNAAITSSSVTNSTDGQEITILWQQDGTGHTIVLPTNFSGATAPTTTAGKFTCQKFTYNLGTTQWYAIAAGVANM